MSHTDDTRRLILDAALKIAPFEGWTDRTLRQAVAACDLPQGAEGLYFPTGVMELLGFWSADIDAAARRRIEAMELSEMKIRDRVTQGVIARLEAIAPHEEAARRASARLALPDGFSHGLKQLWAAADMIWRAIGDTSTDANFYSKRAILSGVIGTTLPVWLSDDTPDREKARAFLDARIANVMSFEKLKWQVKSKTGDLPNPAELLGALRYGGIERFTKPRRGRARRRRYSR